MNDDMLHTCTNYATERERVTPADQISALCVNMYCDFYTIFMCNVFGLDTPDHKTEGRTGKGLCEFDIESNHILAVLRGRTYV